MGNRARDSKAARQDSEMCASRKESRRISRRQQEAEQWAQDRMHNLCREPIPTNRAATDYLTLHYPWLLDKTSDTLQKLHLGASTHSAGGSLATMVNGSATKVIEPVLSSNKSSLSIPASSKIGPMKEPVSVSATRLLSTRLPAVTPGLITSKSSHLSYAAVLASKAPPVTPKQSGQRKVSLRRSDKTTHETQKQDPPVDSHPNGQRLGGFAAYTSTLSLDAGLAAKSSASFVTAEHCRALTAATDNRIGRLIAESSQQQAEGLLDILKNTTSWVNQRERFRSNQEMLSVREVDSNRDPKAVEAYNKVYEFIKALSEGSHTQHELVTSKQLQVSTNDCSGGPEPETMLFASSQLQHTVLLPNQQTPQLSSFDLDQLALARQGSCSPSKQSLRPTAPVFVPLSPRIASGTNSRKICVQSPTIAPSLVATSGSRSLAPSTRPTTASSTVNSLKPASSHRPSSASRISAPIQDFVYRKTEDVRRSGSIPTASYRLVSMGTETLPMVKPTAMNLEYMSAPTDEVKRKARAVLAIEIACSTIHAETEELLSFLAIRVPAVDEIIAHPSSQRKIQSRLGIGGKYDLSRFMVPASKPNDSAGIYHSASTIYESSQGGYHWHAQDFEGFRVLPSSLWFLEIGNGLDDLAEVAASKHRGEPGFQRDPEGLQTPQALGVRHGEGNEALVEVDDVLDRGSANNHIDSSAETSESHKDDQSITTGSRIVKNYKEEAYFSDPDDTSPVQRKQVAQKVSTVVRARHKQQQHKHLLNGQQYQPKASPHTPLQQVERQPEGLLDAYRTHISRQHQATKDQQVSQKGRLVHGNVFQDSPTPFRYAPTQVWPQIPHPSHCRALSYHVLQEFWQQRALAGPHLQNTYPNQHFFPAYWQYPESIVPVFYE